MPKSGRTPNKDKRTAIRLNPPFHPATRQIGGPNGPKLRRGYIIHASNTADNTANRSWRGRIEFQYNPAAIDVQHDQNVPTSDALGITNPDESTADNGQNLNATGTLSGVGSLSVPLLFDRTYDLWDKGWRKKLSGQYGAYADVLAFYHFFEMTDTTILGPNASIAEGMQLPLDPNNQVWGSLYPVKPPVPTTGYVYIGDKVKYFGYFGGFTVSYTHFNHVMVPQRAAVNLSMQLLPDPNVTGRTAGGDFYVDAPTNINSTRPGLPPGTTRPGLQP